MEDKENNPYIGARAYEPTDKVGLYGRKREVTDLLGRLVAQRIILMYSPSGAGKTSLIESALVPALDRQRLSVLPRIRVGLEVGTSASENRYIQSTLASIRVQRRGITLPFTSAKHPFVTAVRAAVQEVAPKSGIVLIFDQFEEIVTLNSVDVEAKHDFFKELGETLAHPKVWALFAMREEYLGLLDAYTHYIPTRFSNRFRLDLLSPAAAEQAIRGPAGEKGATFTNTAVVRLLDDLRLTKEMGPDGDAQDMLGPVIEPVHLQVVCRRLWERLEAEEPQRDPSELRTIDVPQVERAGNVTDALRAYYQELVASVSKNTYVDERRIRLWIGSELITGGRLRNQVMRTGRRTAGLDERVIDALSDVYLVRKESRRRLIWYELAHDRLIDPIVEDNEAWFASHPTSLQRVAQIWATHGRAKELLLRGDALEAFENARAKAPDLTEIEREYLETSQRVDKEDQARRMHLRRQLRQATVGSCVAVLAALGWVFYERQSADTQANDILGIVDSLDSGDSAAKSRASLSLLQITGEDKVHVRYFAHAADREMVEAALDSLPYPLERDEGEDQMPSNQVLYGRYVSVADARRVAIALVAAGVPIKRVSRFRTIRLLNSYEIQVLAAPQLENAPRLTVDSVKGLSPSQTSVGTPIPLAPPADSGGSARASTGPASPPPSRRP
jgi:hypothetical protein